MKIKWKERRNGIWGQTTGLHTVLYLPITLFLYPQPPEAGPSYSHMLILICSSYDEGSGLTRCSYSKMSGVVLLRVEGLRP